MSLVAPIVDGVLQTTTTSSESLSKSNSSGSSINSDTFLTLLVAEMQNQDPLEPTSNTEWVSQYATFTQVEQIGEMADSMDVLRANALVGKEVIMKVTSESTGETSYQRGIVDYIVMENGEALLNIGGSNYSMDDLDTVASDDYYEAYDFYTEFVKKIDALPSLKLIDTSYENTVGSLYEMYSNMTEYQSEYMNAYAPLYLENYQLYIDKMEQLGITYGEEGVVEEVTTLDDVLEAFNQKMDALMEQMASIGKTESSSSSSDSNDDASEASNASGSTSNAGGTENASGSTDNAGSAENASGSTDNAGSTENASGSTDNAGNTDNVSGSTDNAENADNANEATQNTATPEADGEASQVSDDTLDLLTQDI